MKEYVGVKQFSDGLTVCDFGLEQGKALAEDPTTQGMDGWPTVTNKRAQGTAPKNDADFYGVFEVRVPPDILAEPAWLSDHLFGVTQGISESE